MLIYVSRRLLGAVPVLIMVSLLAFALIHIIPGDAAQVIAGPDATADQIASIRATLGLDRPILEQFLVWLGNLARFDLGMSFMLGRSVAQAIVERLPVTLLLTLYSMVLTVPLGILAGLIAAYKHNRWADTAIMTVALLGVSLPTFWLSIAGILLFSVHLNWLPSGGYVPPTEDLLACIRSLTLPALALAAFQIGLLARMTRATTLEILRQDYVRTARAKGVSENKVLGRHAFANVLVPVVTVIGIIVNVALSGAVVIEEIFSLPGLGRLVVQGILRRDYPVIQGSLLVVAMLMVFINLMVDLLYAYLDPRVEND
ncbi:ABC transporter permease [Chelatococcus asaccharovorans]|uniref:Peptide/nickel transport system permease protein n=1 Tax=Chelatococcus asaccharovorans TaxID=28210 RepID=A0A2V3UFU4_9HYPH|nr:ABC transporter permease [Chelatococcus asaccharovorans]MBS7707441.1 ABC transporter permease [Chelatococcus asaccharovorans]PXW63621.1 peptide/nickel transport system permease protein [Chelatococcus asaccharovorans]CAH1650085.1 glutathione ABC transporter membrane subunit GsiC [Chelatococcus asaccharovorans]CAH1692031.1 glutathione ABC transporter membrane subunit GsiC [Chelatococcus asaccharovorans]